LTVWDDEVKGLGVRVLASGRKSWVVRYRLAGRQEFVSLGAVENLTAKEARRRAGTMVAEARLGKDPRAELKARRQAAPQPATLTVEHLVNRYLTSHAEKNLAPKTVVSARRALVTLLKPLHRCGAADLTRRQVADALDRVARDIGDTSANRARSYLSMTFSWGMERGLVEANPVLGSPRFGSEEPRDRVLRNHELASVWNTCSGTSDYEVIVRLLILTGQRREEVAGMRWSELDLAAALWRIPRERTKNNRAHEVPLSAPALDALRSRNLEGRRDFVFGKRAGPFSGWSAAKKRLDSHLATSGVEIAPWRLHDLRRTVVTGMADLGVQPHVAEALVNHISGHKAGIAGVYNHATYRGDKAEAVARWAAHIETLALSGERKVLPLVRGA
jgi:integrase